MFKLVLFCTMGCFPVLAQDFFSADQVNTIELIFEEADWDQVLDDYFAAENGERLVATAIINGERFEQVGVRYKGNSSYSRDRVKNPFNIKLDYLIEDQNLDGYDTLKLSNGFMDPSFVREVLGYEIAAKYAPASKATYSKVYINGSYYGLYVSVQAVDKTFLDQHFQCDDNALFEGEIAGGPGGSGSSLAYLGDDPSLYSNAYDLESGDGWEALINLCKTLNQQTDQVGHVLNVDTLLWFMAFHNVLVSLDSPINFSHNFYLYQAASQQFHYIFWDLNMTFGSFRRDGSAAPGGGGPPGGAGGGQFSLQQLQEFDPLFNVDNAQFPILNKILPIDRYRKAYIAHMKTILEENFSNGWYLTRIAVLQALVADAVHNDPNKFFTYEDFGNSLDQTIPSGRSEGVPGIAELMEARIAYLSNRTEFQAEAPQISAVEHGDPGAGQSMTVSARVAQASSVTLMYRVDPTQAFQDAPMYDDGTHGDGVAGDGVYTTTVAIGSVSVAYYLHAENEDAAAFSPRRAAFEYHLAQVHGDLVINEVQALNQGAQTDENGDAGDWIELYNNGTQTINLNGYYLSDDAADLTKWRFPEVALEAGGFLVIWADDHDDEPLHAGFKLSALAEAVFLSDPAGEVLDAVVYRDATGDRTLGRMPNGTGSFVTMTPSIGTVNFADSNDVVINEILAHSHGEAADWVELANTSSQSIDLSGWTLSDDAAVPQKYRFADGTRIGPGEFLVLNEAEHFGSNSSDPGRLEGFALSENGETLYLFAVENGKVTRLVDQEDFGASQTGVSFGRYYKASTGTVNFVPMSAPSPGAVNSLPLTGPVVISQVMYHPADMQGDAEYLQLTNISDTTVTFYDEEEGEAWTFTSGIVFSFPEEAPISLAPGEQLLLVQDESAFLQAFGGVEGTRILTWDDGGLANGGEKLELSRPGDLNEDGERQYIRVDRVNYADEAPWPSEADGTGNALMRKALSRYGNDPSNWQAQAPTPGVAALETRLLYPWVSNRTNAFESVLIVNNLNGYAVETTLTASRADGNTETVIRTVPAHGFLEVSAAQLFPSLGSGDGTCVLLTAPAKGIYGRWVTNSLGAASGQSPSQGVAAAIPDPGSANKQRVAEEIVYSYLPTDERTISAAVLVNAGLAATDVTLQFFDADGNQVGRSTTGQIAPYQPFAGIANQLIEGNYPAVTMKARSADAKLAGVSFVFDQVFLETAIGNVSACNDEERGGAVLVYPWISNREGIWSSVLTARNDSETAVDVVLTARREQGDPARATRTIAAGGLLVESAASLFPSLGDGSGFCVTLESPTSRIQGQWVTYNHAVASGKSPAQAAAINASEAVSERKGQDLLLGYLPLTGAYLSAPVIINLGREPADVTLSFYDADGNLVFQDDSLRGLEPYTPYARTANELVPAGSGNLQLVASSSGPELTGVVFVFNGVFAEPAIGNATGIDWEGVTP